MAQVPQVPGDVSNEDVVNNINNVVRELNNRDTVQVFKDDTGTRRVLLGKGKDGFYGIKVSQEGSDVYDASDDDLVFNSNQNVFKVVATGNTTIPSFDSTTGYSSVTVPHGQNHIPLVQIYANGAIVDGSISIISTGYIPLPITFSPVALASNYYFENTGGGTYRPLGLNYAVDDTNIYIQAGCDPSLSSFIFDDVPVTYYILQETAN